MYLQVISAHVRKLLGITLTPGSSSIADLPRDVWTLFLEKKSWTGEWADSLTYQQFLDGIHHWSGAWHESQRYRSTEKIKTETCQCQFISPTVRLLWLWRYTHGVGHMWALKFTLPTTWMLGSFGVFFFVPSHCKRKLMKYPLTDLTREISVMRIK